MLRRLSLLLALGWMAGIFYLSHQPTLDLPALFDNQDKVMHFGAYGLLGALLLGAMRLTGAGGYSTRQLALATLIASLYGITDEFHQSFVPGRTPDVLDWLADTSGALLATFVLAQLSRGLSACRRAA
jgi:VanZ family protein